MYYVSAKKSNQSCLSELAFMLYWENNEVQNLHWKHLCVCVCVCVCVYASAATSKQKASTDSTEAVGIFSI